MVKQKMDITIHAGSRGRQRNCQDYDAVHQTHSTSLDNNHQNEQHLMQAVVEQKNMRLAFKRVIANKGAPGIDGMTVDDLKQWLIENWHKVTGCEVAEGYGLTETSPVTSIAPFWGPNKTGKLGLPVSGVDWAIFDSTNLQQLDLPVCNPFYKK